MHRSTSFICSCISQNIRIPALLQEGAQNQKEAGRAKSCQGALTSREIGRPWGSQSCPVSTQKQPLSTPHWGLSGPTDSHFSNASPLGSGLGKVEHEDREKVSTAPRTGEKWAPPPSRLPGTKRKGACLGRRNEDLLGSGARRDHCHLAGGTFPSWAHGPCC